jgi:hypothetical protein
MEVHEAVGKFLESIDQIVKGSRSSLALLPELFPPVDLDHIRKTVRIEQRAAENGQSELPPKDAQSPDAIELDVEGRLQEIMGRYIADYDQQTRLVNDRIFEYGTLLDLQSINSDCRKMLGNLKAEANNQTNELYKASEELRNKAAEIRHFRLENGLEKILPHYPENPLMKFAILMMLVLFEIVVNYLLIREAGDMASVAGSAVLYSFVNVIVPYWLWSEWIRFANHIKRRRAAIGWLGLVSFVVYAVIVNLMMAHYRGVVIEMTSQVELAETVNVGFITTFLNNQITALDNFLEKPFGLKDTISWFLWLFGVALSIGGLLSGYRSDDVYPRYGDLERRYNKLFSRYVDAIEDTIEILGDKRDEGSIEIDDARKALEMEFRKIPNMVTNAGALQSRCNLALERLDTDFNLLVKEYRQANQRNRSTPAPEYFDRPVSLGKHELPSFESPAIEKPEKAVKVLQNFSDQLHEMFDEIIESLASTRQVLQDGYPFKVNA